jgi:mannosyltransferase
VQNRKQIPFSKIILIAVIVLGVAALLFFGYLKLFNDGKLLRILSRRQVLDGLAVSALTIAAGLYLFLRLRTTRTRAPRRGRFDWRWAIPLALLILLAAGFRFHKLDFQSLWRDEIASVARVESASLPAALVLGNWQDAWPSYHIPLYGFVRLAGDSEFAFRFPSALAGILLIPVLFVLGRRMFSAREGLIAAGLAVAIRTPLWYSQEMRSYAFLMLYAALSAYFWYRLAEDLTWRGKAGRFALVGYVATAILTIYAHYFGLVLVGVEGLAALLLVIHLRRIPLSLAAVYAAIGLAYVPWVPLVISDLGKQDFWSGKPSWSGGWFYGFLSFVYRSPLVLIALGLGVVGFAVVLWRAYRRRDQGVSLPLAVTPCVLLVGWLVLPYAIAYWRSVTATPILVDRYLLVSLPAAYLLLARAVTRLPVGRLLQGLAGAGLVGFVIVHLLTGPYYVAPNKTQLREAVSYIAVHEGQAPGQVIIAGYQGGKKELDYYFRKFGSSSTIDIKAGNAWQIDDVRAQLAERRPRAIWFIGQHLFFEKEFQDFLDQEFKRVGEYRFYDVTVFLYENPAGK